MPNYQVKVVHTRTGAVLDDLPFSSFSLTATVDWARHDSMSVTVPLTGTDSRREQVTGIAYEPWKRSLLLVRDGVAVWAGPIMTTRWGHTSVEFACGGLTQLFDARLVNKTIANTTKMTTTARAAARVLIRAAYDTISGAAYGLPVQASWLDLDALKSTRTYVGADLTTVYEAVKKVVEEDGGPDIVLRPLANTDLTYSGWRAFCGDPHLGRVDPLIAWDFPATITSLTGDLDGSSMVTRGFVLGDGSSDQRAIVDRTNNLTDDGYPVLERADRTQVSTRDANVLRSLAASYVAANGTQASAWAVQVDPTYPGLNGWDLGDNAKFRTSGHWFLPDGERVRRITGFTLTDDSLALETAPPLEG
ncbi:hypothetical protein [Pseudonocardia alni]|uniref:hypothetical protein n=1 Tax=Pseudonocardia alni TaxID=33907 RepID=UPI00331B8CDC